jgi:hypothetical protein
MLMQLQTRNLAAAALAVLIAFLFAEAAWMVLRHEHASEVPQSSTRQSDAIWKLFSRER